MGVGCLVGCVKALEVLNNEFHFLRKILIKHLYILFFSIHYRKPEIVKILWFCFGTVDGFLMYTFQYEELGKSHHWLSLCVSIGFLVCFWGERKFWPHPVLVLYNTDSWIKMPSQSLSLNCGIFRYPCKMTACQLITVIVWSHTKQSY